MHRLSLALLLLAACAPALPAPATDRIVATDQRGQVYRSTSSDVAAEIAVAAPIDRVVAALQAIYAELGVPAVNQPGPVGRLGNARFQARGKLAGHPMSDYFDCGSSITGPRTNGARLTISMISSYVAEANATRVRTLITAEGRDMADGTSNDPFRCTSTGRLEERVTQMLRERVGGGG